MKKDITENLFLVTPAAEDSEPANLRNETDFVAYDGMISGRICTLCDLCVLQITKSKHYYCTKKQKKIHNIIADVCQFYQYGRGHADTHTRTSECRENRKRRE